MQQRMEHMNRRVENEGREVVDLAAVREARSSAMRVLEQRQSGVERAASLQRGLLDSAYGVSCECAEDTEGQPQEPTREVAGMWSARIAKRLEQAGTAVAA
jgi:hypothetical protein